MIYAIKRFMVLDKDDEDRLKLTGLEYLKEYEGKNGDINNEKTGVSFFSKNGNQETKVDNIYVDKKGNLSDYPSGLLDEWGILMTELI